MRRIFFLLIMLALVGAGIGFFGLSSRATAQPPASPSAQLATPAPGAIPPNSLADAWKKLGDEQRRPAAILTVIALVVITLPLFWLGSFTDMLRDDTPHSFGGAPAGAGNKMLRRPFSMAQCQMTWWFLLVLASYLYLFVVTGEINTLSGQALMLMGIGTGTALGAAMVEQNKTASSTLQTFETTLQQLDVARKAAGDNSAAIQGLEDTRNALAVKLASKNFLNDILTDVNGISLHRFQAFIWTIVLGVIFLIEVVVEGKMPEFDAYTLGVLGISAGTYLGLKIPEQPT